MNMQKLKSRSIPFTTTQKEMKLLIKPVQDLHTKKSERMIREAGETHVKEGTDCAPGEEDST